MEQCEGRVDRVGWGRADEGHIDVRFMLLKGTYEERIFHAVMQRDQWFQVLIGSKRRELGQPDDDETAIRLEILKKAFPSSGQAARPIDLFDHDRPEVFALPVERPFDR